MKTKYILLILTAWLTASCSLQEDTEGFSTPGDFYKTKTQCQSAVNSCYIPLKNLYTYKMMIATEGVTDLMYIASGTQDAQLDISPSQPRFGADMWTYGYRGVMYCNMAVTGIENSTIDEKDRHSLVAEAKVLRAFYYYLLTSFFGDVPFYTDDVSDHEVLDRVAKLPRMSAEATRTALIEEPPWATCSSPNSPCGTRITTRRSKPSPCWNRSTATTSRSTRFRTFRSG